MVIAAAAALASAWGFALSTSLQHRAASGAPSGSGGPLALVGYLVRQRTWLLGVSAGGVSFCLHALALNLGAIALVQPIMVCGIVFAVLLRAGIERTRPSRSEMTAVSVTALGLALFLVAADPSTSGTAPDDRRAAVLVVLGWAAVALLVASQRDWTPRFRAATLGVAAGLGFGLTAGLVKLLTVDVGGSDLGTRTLVTVAALAVTGVTGVVINQQAYRLAPLSVSMPVLNVVSVCFAVSFGALVLAEYPDLSPVAVVGQLAGLMLIGLGLWIIAARVDPTGVGIASQAEHDRRGGRP